MTCIVGVEQAGRVWMGGDSAGVHKSSLSLEVRNEPKVFKKGSMVIGFTTSYRMGQLLQHSLVLPMHPKGKPSDEYLCTDFVNAVRRCFNDGGFLTRKDGEESGGIFLLGYKKRLYIVYNDFQIGSVACGYNACGCGRDLALGSLHGTRAFIDDPKQRIVMALEAAAQFSVGVSPPFTIISS